jgi:hypothetical protein
VFYRLRPPPQGGINLCRRAAFKLSSAKFRWFYGPCPCKLTYIFKMTSFSFLVLNYLNIIRFIAKIILRSVLYGPPPKKVSPVLYGDHIRLGGPWPLLKIRRITPLQPQRVAGGVIKPILRLVFYALHRRLVATATPMQPVI